MFTHSFRGQPVVVVGPYGPPADDIPAVVLVRNADGVEFVVHEADLLEAVAR